MNINSIHLKNFKRFSDLSIENIPNTAKLVLLIGTNGTGKSCIFDAFELMNNKIKFTNFHVGTYYSKQKGEVVDISIETPKGNWNISNIKSLSRTNWRPFYGRTSFRQTPELKKTTLGDRNIDFAKDSDKPISFIQRDIRFENDIENITYTILEEIFRKKTDTKAIHEHFIQPINDAFQRIFQNGNNTLELIDIIPPLEGKIAQINFRKGQSEIHYNYLSAGEKEIVNILFNLLSRRSLFQDTIYFFDEIDLHLNTALQYRFLQEIVEHWIPENCQFWTASHSLGFIDYAMQTETAVIIDLDDLNFDEAHRLSPSPKDNSEVYEVAVSKEMLPSIFKHINLFFVENKDAKLYSSIGIENTVFIPENGRNGVFHKVKEGDFKGLVDRDFLSDEDIGLIRNAYPNLRVLNYYSIENYLYHPDNLEEYYVKVGKTFDKAAYIQDLVTSKNEIIEQFIYGISMKRTEYPYFKEPAYNGKPKQNRFKNKKENEQETPKISAYLKSDELESFYKVLPMKTYCTQLPQRQNISKTELVKTDWFKKAIRKILV